jgi:hypothetical protein
MFETQLAQIVASIPAYDWKDPGATRDFIWKCQCGDHKGW